MSQPLVSIILPTRERHVQARTCIEQYWRTTAGQAVEIIVTTDEAASWAALQDVCLVSCLAARYTALELWNYGAAMARGNILVLAADDTWPQNGWLTEVEHLLLTLPGGDGMIGLNDLARGEADIACHWAMTRQYAVRWNGGVLVCPQYRHYFCDNEATARGRRAGRYLWAQDAVIEHRHPAWGKAQDDALYRSHLADYQTDAQMFAWRQARGFPNDFPAVLDGA